MAEKRPTTNFGKRRPAPLPLPPKEPVKRSGHVALLVMGTIAVGTTAYALMPRSSCDPPSPGMASPADPQQATACSNRSSSGGSGGSGRWSSRSSFFSSDSSSHSSSAGSSDSGSGGVTRGGFGSFAHAFGFSGHG
jgi:hypothetical protein